MKKIFLLAAAALLIGGTANAQDVMKQQGGERNFEVLFAPLGESPIGINGVKYRSFTSSTTAWRASVSLNLNTSSSTTTVENVDFQSSSSNFGIAVAPGYEWHFAGTDRLSPYVGAEVSIGFGRTTTNADVEASDGDIVDLRTMAMSTFNAGAGVFAGFDFYFADNVYLGAELNFGLMLTSAGDTTSEFLDGEDDIEEEVTPGSNSFSVGEGAVGSIRVGFLF